MGIGTGIFLLVVGAILAFAVRDTWDVMDLTAVGYICMAAGVLAIVLVLVMNAQRNNRRTVVERYDEQVPPPAPGGGYTRVERRDTTTPPTA